MHCLIFLFAPYNGSYMFRRLCAIIREHLSTFWVTVCWSDWVVGHLVCSRKICVTACRVLICCATLPSAYRGFGSCIWLIIFYMMIFSVSFRVPRVVDTPWKGESYRRFIRKLNTDMYAWCMALPEYYRRKLVLSFVFWGLSSWA
jgi:hypothetical protein